MRHIDRFAAVSALALCLALAACGAPEEEAGDTDIATQGVQPIEDLPYDPDPATMEGETPDAQEGGEAPGAGQSSTPAATSTPTPTPTASATRRPAPTPTPTQARVSEPAAFSGCKSCHSVQPGQNGVGPTLAGVVGRRAGSVSGFNYSDAMEGANLTWNEGNLNRLLTDPQAVVPGTTMVLLSDLSAAERTAIINYLKTQ